MIGLGLAAAAVSYLGGPHDRARRPATAGDLLDAFLMRGMDVLLAFPPLLFALVLVTGAGTSAGVLIVAVGLVQMPGISRIVRAATLEVSVRGYVEAAVARGERTPAILATRDPAQHHRARARRLRAALHLRDRHHREHELPRPRADARRPPTGG